MFKNTTVLLDAQKPLHLPSLWFTYWYWYVNMSICHWYVPLSLMPAGRNVRILPRQIMISQEPKCGVILTLYMIYSSKIAVTFEPIMQFWLPLRFRIYSKYKIWPILWRKAPSQTMSAWRWRKVIFKKDLSVNLLITIGFLSSSWGLKIPNHGSWGASGGL